MKRLWRDYSLLWVMLLICVVALAIEAVLEYGHLQTQYRWHGETMTMADYWRGFVQQLAGRVAASVLVLIIFTVARASLVYRGSPVSRDGPDERTELLREIREEVEELHEKR